MQQAKCRKNIPERGQSTCKSTEAGGSLEHCRRGAVGGIRSEGRKEVGKICDSSIALFWGAPKSLQMVTAAMILKDACSLAGKL